MARRAVSLGECERRKISYRCHLFQEHGTECTFYLEEGIVRGYRERSLEG